MVNIHPGTIEEMYKIASINLSPGTVGQVAMSCLVNPPKPGEVRRSQPLPRAPCACTLQFNAVVVVVALMVLLLLLLEILTIKVACPCAQTIAHARLLRLCIPRVLHHNMHHLASPPTRATWQCQHHVIPSKHAHYSTHQLAWSPPQPSPPSPKQQQPCYHLWQTGLNPPHAPTPPHTHHYTPPPLPS